MARVGSELKQWIYIYFLLLLTHLLRGREFVTCSVFPALHRLSLPLFLHILQSVCVGLMHSLLHPLNSQGLWNAYTLYIHKKAFSYKWQEKWRPHTQHGGGRGHSVYKEHILQLPLQSLPFYPMLHADHRSTVSDNCSKNQISPQGKLGDIYVGPAPRSLAALGLCASNLGGSILKPKPTPLKQSFMSSFSQSCRAAEESERALLLLLAQPLSSPGGRLSGSGSFQMSLPTPVSSWPEDLLGSCTRIQAEFGGNSAFPQGNEISLQQ